MNGWIETKVQEIKFLWYWVLCHLTIHERAPVELPLLATILQWLLLLVLAESPYIRSFFNLSTTYLRTPQWQWPLKRIPTATITSWQWPVNQWLTNSINKNPSLAVTGHQIWCIWLYIYAKSCNPKKSSGNTSHSYLSSMVTSLQRPLFSDRKMAIVQRFNCINRWFFLANHSSVTLNHF